MAYCQAVHSGHRRIILKKRIQRQQAKLCKLKNTMNLDSIPETVCNDAPSAGSKSILCDIVICMRYLRQKKEYIENMKRSVANKLISPGTAVDESCEVLENIHQKLCLMLASSLAAPFNGRMHAPHPGEFVSATERHNSLCAQMGIEPDTLSI